MKAVIDTNVLLVANGRHDDVSPDCVIECTRRLQALQQQGVVVIDDAHRIVGEYRHKTSPNSPKGVGDVFLKWLLQNSCSLRVEQVSLNENGTPPTQVVSGAVRRNALAAATGLASVPCVACEKFSVSALEQLVATARSRAGPLEGVVIRREPAEWCEARAKLVQPDFIQAIETHWRRRPLEWNPGGLGWTSLPAHSADSRLAGRCGVKPQRRRYSPTVRIGMSRPLPCLINCVTAVEARVRPLHRLDTRHRLLTD